MGFLESYVEKKGKSSGRVFDSSSTCIPRAQNARRGNKTNLNLLLFQLHSIVVILGTIERVFSRRLVFFCNVTFCISPRQL